MDSNSRQRNKLLTETRGKEQDLGKILGKNKMNKKGDFGWRMGNFGGDVDLTDLGFVGGLGFGGEKSGVRGVYIEG